MEQTYSPSVPGQRPISGRFNPEAVEFSPTAAKAGLTSGQPTPPASPQQRISRMPSIFDDDSPFRPSKNMRPIYEGHDEADGPRLPGTLPNQKEMPLQDLQKMLREHSIALEHSRQGTVFQDSRPRGTMDRAIGQPPSGLFSPDRRDPSFNAPDVDELSASLGLPGMKKRIPTDDSPARSHNSRLSEGVPEGLYGKLIGRALDKPLTADALAQYLNGKRSADDMVAGGIQGLHRFGSIVGPKNRDDGDDQAIKVVRPPPGFGGVLPRMILAEERIAVDPELQYAPTGPVAFGTGPPRRFSDLSAISHAPQHYGHVRRPSSKRYHRHRAYTHTKRMDQGPEPSHADIYPDDAVPNHMPRRPSYQQQEPPDGYFGTYRPPQCQEFQVQDPDSWPTPAEVYTQEQKPASPPRRSTFAQHAAVQGAYGQEQVQGTYDQEQREDAHAHERAQGEATGETPLHRIFSQYNAIFPQHQARTPTPPFDVFANHHRPSKSDILDGKEDMEALLNDVANLSNDASIEARNRDTSARDSSTCDTASPDTYAYATIPDLPVDARPMTPSQKDGKRYGIEFHGIGLGDSWMPNLEVKDGEAFRVRPRNHEGWGGWEWAFRGGWGDEHLARI